MNPGSLEGRIAFKEWSSVCAALAGAAQHVILRKGGIADEGGIFRTEHDRFWLFPTYLHQHLTGVRLNARHWYEQALAARPAAQVVPLQLFVEVERIYRVRRLPDLLALEPFHILSAEAVEKKFHYREPGCTVLAVSVRQLPAPVLLPDNPIYDGCKSWVPLLEGIAPPTTPTQIRPPLDAIDQILKSERIA
jgi:hypothetical protein